MLWEWSDLNTDVIFQVSDYIMQPETAMLGEQVKACLQETEDVPHDITSLFDGSVFRLDTSIVSKVIK